MSAPTIEPAPAAPTASPRGNSTRVPTLVRATDALLCAGLTAQLRHRPELALIGTDETADPSSVVAVVAGDQIGEELMQLVRATHRLGHARVVLVAGHLDDAAIFTALESGVCGIVAREGLSAEQLVRAVGAAAKGHGFVAPEVLGRILDQVGRVQRQILAPHGLTMSPLRKREIDVLRLLAEGADTGEIARELAYSERTIKNIIHDLTVRLGLRNRTHAVAYAVREGLI